MPSESEKKTEKDRQTLFDGQIKHSKELTSYLRALKKIVSNFSRKFTSLEARKNV